MALALACTVSLGCDDGGISPSTHDESSTGEASGTTSSDPSSPTNPTSATSPATSAGMTATSTTGTPPSTSTTSDPPPDDDDGSSEDSEIPSNGWLEIGYGLDEFFPFDGDLPVYLGPQGFMMFSLPLRGADFPVPPEPTDFDHPDTPILTVWADVEGIDGPHPSGHFAIYQNYPVPFSNSLQENVDYEFVSVWLVIPEDLPPEELAGREAVVHAELQCADGQFLVDEHTLTIIDATDENPAG